MARGDQQRILQRTVRRLKTGDGYSFNSIPQAANWNVPKSRDLDDPRTPLQPRPSRQETGWGRFGGG